MDKKSTFTCKISIAMEENVFFTPEEHKKLCLLYKKLLRLSDDMLREDDCKKLKGILIEAARNQSLRRDVFGLNPIIKDMETTVIVAEEIGMQRASILGIMLHESVQSGYYTIEQVKQDFGEDVAGIIRGLNRIQQDTKFRNIKAAVHNVVFVADSSCVQYFIPKVIQCLNIFI